jgi:hypothetical protein
LNGGTFWHLQKFLKFITLLKYFSTGIISYLYTCVHRRKIEEMNPFGFNTYMHGDVTRNSLYIYVKQAKIPFYFSNTNLLG